jgi:CubicO group peptidase (beta-lactamase class C family)
LEDKIQNFLEKLTDYKSVLGTTLRVENGKGDLLFNGATGNFKTDSQYFIASTTKLYTVAAVMKLRSEGLLSLDDTLAKYFAQEVVRGLNIYKGIDYSDHITIKQLLAHTSGIPDYFEGKNAQGSSFMNELTKGIDIPYTFDDAINWAKAMKATFAPGQKGKALYSDTNFQLLGRIVEILRKDTLENVFIKEIFVPLALNQTYVFTNQPQQKPIDMNWKDKPLIIPLAMSCMACDGGIVSTSAESMLFLKAFFAGKFFPKDYFEEMCKDYLGVMFPLQYGTGIMRYQLPGIFTLFRHVPEMLGHSGLSGAFEYYVPERDWYFTGTVNQVANPSISYRMLTNVLMMLK